MSALSGHFQFTQPGWLILLLPALLTLLLRRGRGAAEAVIFPNLSTLLSLGKRVRQRAWSFWIPLACLALISAVLGMARPVLRTAHPNRSSSGIDIMIAFDVSLSMQIDDFVQNGLPIQRIDAAKQVAGRFIDLRRDDRLGMVAFAGRPVSVSPMTLDHQWLKQQLDGLYLNDGSGRSTVKEQGTAIGSALAMAAVRLEPRQAKSKIIVLITDGANNSGMISPLDAAQQAKTLGIKIYTVAIGTTGGRLDIETQANPRQEFDLDTLQKIAALTGGEHYWAQDLTTLENTFRSIDALEKSEARSPEVIEDIELFPWFAGFALFSATLSALHLCFNPRCS